MLDCHSGGDLIVKVQFQVSYNLLCQSPTLRIEIVVNSGTEQDEIGVRWWAFKLRQGIGYPFPSPVSQVKLSAVYFEYFFF